MERTAGNAHLDEYLFNTYDSPMVAPPWAFVGRGEYEPVNDAVDAGPGAFVTPGEPWERGYNAWYGAPGYYVSSIGVERVIDDQRIWNMYPPQVYDEAFAPGNPWDYIFGTIGSYGVFQGSEGVGIRDWGDQGGQYSLS